MKIRDLFPMDDDFSPAVNICGTFVVLFIYYLALSSAAETAIKFSAWVLAQ